MRMLFLYREKQFWTTITDFLTGRLSLNAASNRQFKLKTLTQFQSNNDMPNKSGKKTITKSVSFMADFLNR